MILVYLPVDHQCSLVHRQHGHLQGSSPWQTRALQGTRGKGPREFVVATFLSKLVLHLSYLIISNKQYNILIIQASRGMCQTTANNNSHAKKKKKHKHIVTSMQRLEPLFSVAASGSLFRGTPPCSGASGTCSRSEPIRVSNGREGSTSTGIPLRSRDEKRTVCFAII